MPDTLILLADGVQIAAVPGDSILSAMKTAERHIHSICGGRGMCGTCRVAVDEDWFSRLPEPEFTELQLLRILKAGTTNHRLACQTVLDASHDGLRFTLDPPPTRMTLKESTT